MTDAPFTKTRPDGRKMNKKKKLDRFVFFGKEKKIELNASSYVNLKFKSGTMIGTIQFDWKTPKIEKEKNNLQKKKKIF